MRTNIFFFLIFFVSTFENMLLIEVALAKVWPGLDTSASELFIWSGSLLNFAEKLCFLGNLAFIRYSLSKIKKKKT